MREKEDLKYLNDIPRWAKIVHIIILWLFYLIGIAALGCGILLVFGKQWFGAIACFAVSGFIIWAVRLIRISNKMYSDIVLKCELQEEGYYTYVKNLEIGEEWEQFVPFEQMQEVLIARTTRYQSRGSNRLGNHIIGAKIIMKWTDEQGNPEYSLFGLEDAKNLEEWLQRFKQNGIPVYSSPANVNMVQQEDYRTGYDELHKMPYDNDTSSPAIGSIRYRGLKLWYSSEMKGKRREKELIRNKKVFNPILLVMLISNFLISVNWMPSWQLYDGMFADDSPSFMISGINFILLIIVGAYWREQVKWFRSLRDVGLIVIAQLMGWVFLGFFQTAPAEMMDAIIVDGLTLALLNGIVFIIFRVIRRFW